MGARLKDIIGHTEYDRGHTYALAGRVGKAELRPDGVAVGRVKGTATAPYEQAISLRCGGDGALRRVDGNCSCPVGFNCKHVAAVLITLERKGDLQMTGAPPERADEATAVVEGWLLALGPEAKTPARAPAPLCSELGN